MWSHSPLQNSPNAGPCFFGIWKALRKRKAKTPFCTEEKRGFGCPCPMSSSCPGGVWKLAGMCPGQVGAPAGQQQETGEAAEPRRGRARAPWGLTTQGFRVRSEVWQRLLKVKGTTAKNRGFVESVVSISSGVLVGFLDSSRSKMSCEAGPRFLALLIEPATMMFELQPFCLECIHTYLG